VEPTLDVPNALRDLLQLSESGSDYVVRTMSGARLSKPKSEVKYVWQLLSGILDDGRDTTEERRIERERELAGESFQPRSDSR
jgi:hypothetical protein